MRENGITIDDGQSYAYSPEYQIHEFPSTRHAFTTIPSTRTSPYSLCKVKTFFLEKITKWSRRNRTLSVICRLQIIENLKIVGAKLWQNILWMI